MKMLGCTDAGYGQCDKSLTDAIILLIRSREAGKGAMNSFKTNSHPLI